MFLCNEINMQSELKSYDNNKDNRVNFDLVIQVCLFLIRTKMIKTACRFYKNVFKEKLKKSNG